MLAFLARYPNQLFKPKELARRLSLKTDREYAGLQTTLKSLDDARQIRRDRRGTIGHLEVPQTVVGRFDMTRQGFGFVIVDGMEQDVFIAPRSRGMAVHGDLVEVSLFAQGTKKRENDARREGEIIRVVERGRANLVGTLERSKNFYIVVPDDRKIARDVFVAEEKLNNAKVGEKVVVMIESWGVGHLNPEGTIVEVLGQAGEPQAEIKSVIREYKLPTSFPKEVVKEAEAASNVLSEHEIRSRLDFRNKICFTIDPEDAKDFDDAVSLEPLPDGNLRLGVHIADVSYYVREGSLLDTEALKRATSVYFPTMVIPMLPEQLSNIVCSLRPNEDRLAYSVFMNVTPRGVVKQHEIRETVIRSKRRFTYEEVEDMLSADSAGRAGGEDEGALHERLRAMQQLSATLTKKRVREGSIDFDLPEAKFQFDEKGKPIAIEKKIRLQSHRLVEEFMLLANQVVARHVGVGTKEEHIKPFLYRIHDSPDPEKVRELAFFVQKLGYSLNIDGGVTSIAMQKLLNQVKGTEVENVINEVTLRSMAKAIYSERNIGHFGLSFQHYSHFTSPIRRYPDLVVHRMLKEYEKGASLERRQEILNRLPFIAKQSSEMERVAMNAERDAVKVMQVEYMKRHLGEEFDAVISGVTHFGVFVEINNLLVQGLIHVRDLEDDYYTYDEKKHAITGRRTGRQYRLGDSVRVKVIRINPEEREIDFALVESN